MISEAELLEMRATSDEALPDTCTITRGTGAGAFDAETGTYAEATPTPVYSGACRLRPDVRDDGVSEQGDAVTTTLRYTLTVSYDAAPLAIGDVVAISESSDPTIDTRHFRVTACPAGSWQIDQRVTVEEVVGRG